MGLYNDCVRLAERIQYNTNSTCESALSLSVPDAEKTTLPQVLQPQYGFDSLICDKVYYISDIHLVHKVVNKFPMTVQESEIREYIREIAQELFSKELREDIQSYKSPYVFFCGDISSSFEIAKIFYEEFINQWEKIQSEFETESDKNRKQKNIFAVLGNHEFWDFPSVEECCNAYHELFEQLDIVFLNNSGCWTYDALIIGGTGFAGENKTFNADDGIYRQALDRAQEIQESEKWNNFYENVLDEIQKDLREPKGLGRILIVVTHNPIWDWKAGGQLDKNCIYFFGHSHKNHIEHDDVFANNQIGYGRNTIRFKIAYVYGKSNPFAGYLDGYYEIDTKSYSMFYHYMSEYMQGTGHIDRRVKAHLAKLYMVKHNGYYGFFLISSIGAYICAGGRIKRIYDMPIQKYDAKFTKMVDKYMEVLAPYRYAQEKIAKMIKSFGGSGKIHGCIIDVDFFNHIMLNPNDGTITYYYSPMFGCISRYDSLMGLLENHNQELAEQYRDKYFKANSNSLDMPRHLEKIPMFEEIDIKNSIYAVSNRINQIQRLFDKGILRAWNDDWALIN